MKIVYAGDTPKFPFEVSYNGTTLDPTDAESLADCEIVLYSRMDSSKVLAKYSLNKTYCETASEWEDLTTSDGSVVLIVDSDITKSNINNEIVMQITNYIVDAEMPDGVAIETGTTTLFKIKEKVG